MPQTIFTCLKCDAQYPKWAGRCLECGAWGTIEESQKPQVKSKKIGLTHAAGQVVKLDGGQNHNLERLLAGFGEFDRVLGGGLVKGGLVLLGGDAGVGKSTLALQIAAAISKKNNCLYISGEESLEQIGQRLNRLSSKTQNLGFLNETKIETILATLEQEQPLLVVIDSIQTIYTEELPSEAGSINQVRACTVKLLEIAKRLNIALLLVGQVTKDGQLAGPKASEHLVDVVLYLEGDQYKQYRLLRAAKNRFDSVTEIGLWQMAKQGLTEVVNPSEIFLSKANSQQSGSVVAPVAEGSRIFLVEVQALVAKTSFGYPKRTSSGFDPKRLEIITTVLTKKGGVNLSNFDVVVNLASGLSFKEPALDLAVALAIVSAWQDQALPEKTAVFGEVGLAGELRPVIKTKERLQECVKLGFKKIILPYFTEEVKNLDLIKLQALKDFQKIFK